MDRQTLLQQAETRAARGDIPGTIKAYQDLLSLDPNDVGVLGALGDLHLRAGEEQAALSCFSDVADHYRRVGYPLKAIAVARRIHQLFPADPANHVRLGDLHAEQGHLADAQQHYLEAATLLREAGQLERALNILRRSAELDAATPAGANLGHRQAMFTQYVTAGLDFLRRGNLQASVEALQMARAMQPQARVPLRLLVNALVKQHNTTEAITLLSRLVHANPQDAELLLLLGRAYAADDNLDAAAGAFSALLRVDSSAYGHLLEVGKRMTSAGNVDGALRCVDQAIGVMIEKRVEYRAASFLVEVVGAFPDNAGARERLAFLEKWIAEHRSEEAPAAPPEVGEPVPPQVFNSQPPPVPPELSMPPTSQATPFLDEGDAVDEMASLESLRRVYLEEGMEEKAATVCMTLAALHQARGNGERARELEAESERLQKASRTVALADKPDRKVQARGVDSLTGLADRESFEDALNREWRRGQRGAEPVSVAILDLDHFQAVNDTEGRPTGDKILRRVASELFAVLKRSPDLVARHDGDAFAVLLPETGAEGARVVVERMLERVKALAIAHPREDGALLTTSAGLVTRVPARNAPASALLTAADAALAEAKKLGRDRVVVAPPA